MFAGKFAKIYETKNDSAQIERMKQKPSKAFSVYRSMQNLSARVSIAKKRNKNVRRV